MATFLLVLISLKCYGDPAGQIVNGLVTIPHSKGDVPGHTVLELEATDSFVILGATKLLEDFSQARLV